MEDSDFCNFSLIVGNGIDIGQTVGVSDGPQELIFSIGHV